MRNDLIARELLSVAKLLIGGGWGRFSEDLTDVLEAQVIQNKTKLNPEIVRIIKSKPDLVALMRDEKMTDRDLGKFIQVAKMMYG